MSNHTFRVAWIDSSFLVVDANQSVEMFLQLLEQIRSKWVVLTSQRQFFVFKSAELGKVLRGKRAGRSIGNVLKLTAREASRTCSLSTRSTSAPAGKGATVARAVALNSHGEAVRVGQIVRGRFDSSLGLRGSTRSGFSGRSAQRKRARAVFVPASTRGIKKKKASPRLKARLSKKQYEIVRIFFATDRSQKALENGRCAFTHKRCEDGKVRLGTCYVSIPFRHKIGELESPSLWHLEFSPKPEKHVVLLSTRKLADKAFYAQVADRVRMSQEREAFVFVHGYDVTFEDAARRTAQIAKDLGFQGAPICYSWPSRGKLRMYPADEATVEWSQQHFEDFLRKLSAKSHANVIHVIAHSMGNRIVMRALSHLGNPAGKREPILHQIVLTAPDIDAGEFENLARAINPFAKRVTMYASSRDKALKLSRRFHSAPRAGESGPHITITNGVDTIDASTVDTSLLGHSYASSIRAVLSDMSYLLKGLPPGSRHGLVQKVHAKGAYWAFSE